MFIKNDYAFFTQIEVFCSHIYQIPRHPLIHGYFTTKSLPFFTYMPLGSW